MSERATRILGNLRSARVDPLLLAIALVAAVPRLWLAIAHHIEYDGYWHVFIAIQDNWEQFRWEYRTNYHPPLYYLLLRVSTWFGRTPLVYRAVSLLTGVASVYVVGRIAAKLSSRRYTPALAALLFALSLPAIVMSCEVRSYMLSVFLMLVSFYYFLETLNPECASRKPRVIFALCAVAAGLSHYSVFFYVVACAVVAGCYDVFVFRHELGKRLLRDLAAFAGIAAALGYSYSQHAAAHAGIANHLRSFYLQPGTDESVVHFLLRNTRALFNQFSPVSVESAPLFYVLLALSVGCLCWTVYGIRGQNLREDSGAAATLLAGAVVLLCLMAGGVARKYPFGGELRQQFILFPFVILCGCVFLDRLGAGHPYRRTTSVLVAAVTIVLAAGWLVAFWRLPKVRADLAAAEMSRFRKGFPSPPAVFVDQFSLILFFTHHHDWDWKFVGPSAVPGVEIYDVSRGGRRMLVLRDKGHWNLNLGQAATYGYLSRCVRGLAVPSVTVFYKEQRPAPIRNESVRAREIIRWAGEADLCVRKLVVRGQAVFAEFRAGHCETEMNAMTQCRRCDDTNWSITYSGNWIRGDYEHASNATLTYTEAAGASASLEFEGTAIRYVYTKAFNRGFAAVTIDGEPKGLVDLYSPNIEWQSSTTFDGLPGGRHTIEIRATGNHRPGSQGNAVDVDALLAR